MAAVETIEVPRYEIGDCGACATRIRHKLTGHPGVVSVGDSREGDLTIRYDPGVCSPECLEDALGALRRDLDRAYTHETYRLEGMDCADCARTIERAVGRLAGVGEVSVSFPAARMTVEFEPGLTSPDRIRALVQRLGYRIVDRSGGGGAGPRRLSRTVTTAGASAALVAALITDFLTGASATGLYALAVAVGGVPLARSGIAALVANRRPTINLLMSVAVVGAAAIGAWLEAALVVVLFSVGEMLEGRAVDRARRELAGLVALAPATARVRRRVGTGPLASLQETEVPVAELVVGDTVVVRPGERIPVDGVVRGGVSSVDQAPITGESAPVDKADGDAVFAGTLNQQGVLLIEATTAPGDTTLDRVAALVAEAQSRRSPSERWVDAFARWYTPLVMAAAAAAAVVPPLLLGADGGESVYAALALLILACPCALVISTPVAIVSALGRASAAGVLVKGGEYLERAAAIRAVAFDKTGTLTEGRPRLVGVHAHQGWDDDEVLALAAGVESASEHPLARAIVAAARTRGIEAPPVSDFTALTGLGARGAVHGREVVVGDLRLVADTSPADSDLVGRLRADGQTVVAVVVDGAPAGVLGIADTLRETTPDAVAGLRSLGIDPILMLTGDNEATAAAIARSAGIHVVRAGLLPHDKAAEVDRHDGIAMVGDGVNDAPALATADLGIAMGSAGSDTAIEVADIAVMGDDPAKVSGLIGLARWTRSVVRQNVAFSLASKLAAAAVLAAGALPLWGAVAADVGASLVVVANGLRLVRGRPLGRRLPLLTVQRELGSQAPRAVGCCADDGCAPPHRV